MMMRILRAVLACVLILGCSPGDPPCPPGARNVGLAEADDALGRRAVREVHDGRENEVAAVYRCYDIGTDRKGDAVVTFANVIECVGIVASRALINRPMTLSRCLSIFAKDNFQGFTDPADHASTIDGLKTATSPMSNVDCIEHYRAVDIEPEKHGLNRMGPEHWVPAVLWVILQAADTIMAPATAPAMFFLKPAASVEEACIDLPAEPLKRCTDESGCPEQPPGAEEPDEGGDVILPGTDPDVPPSDPGDGL